MTSSSSTSCAEQAHSTQTGKPLLLSDSVAITYRLFQVDGKTMVGCFECFFFQFWHQKINNQDILATNKCQNLIDKQYAWSISCFMMWYTSLFSGFCFETIIYLCLVATKTVGWGGFKCWKCYGFVAFLKLRVKAEIIVASKVRVSYIQQNKCRQ